MNSGLKSTVLGEPFSENDIMKHDTKQALGRDADESSPASGTKNSIVISQNIAADLELVEGQQVAVKNLDAGDVRRGTGRYIGAFQIVKIFDKNDVVLFGKEGRDLLSDDEEFRIQIRNQVPDNTLTVSEARRLNESIETLQIADYDSDILVLAPHSGAIEANTEESAQWFARKCTQYCVNVDVYTFRGFGRASFSRWHVGSSAFHLRSFPKLREVTSRQYSLVVAFHLRDIPNDENPPEVRVGGLSDEALRERAASRLDDALPSKYHIVTDPSRTMMGRSSANITNKLSRDGRSGLQIESTPRNQQIRRKTVGREMALSVLEYLGETE
jgi:phage replication-related protein YjqB (UPF0714/DUF867 family)